MVRRRVRIRFRKDGDLRLIGHLDLVRLWERMLRRAGMALAMSEGCHPRARVRFPSALPMGETGCDEVVEFDFHGTQTSDDIRDALDRCAPPGLVPLSAEELSPNSRASGVREFAYEFPLPADRQAEVTDRVNRLVAEPTLPIVRGGGPAVEMRPWLVTAEVTGGVLRFRIRASNERSLRARDLLTVLELDDLRDRGLYPVRTEVLLAHE
jgi:radical SAM-linked protein